MKIRISLGALVVAGALGGVAVSVAACGDDRDQFDTPDKTFPDAGLDAAPDCRLRCSLDGRSVVESCTGEVVETCPPTLACGGAACLEPCRAAAEDRSSNGCDFYFQAPRYTKEFPQSCYAAFLVNTSLQPARVSLELEGKALDVSKAMFRSEPGSTNLVPHVGVVEPGESVILFVSDRPANSPPTGINDGTYVPCPIGAVSASLADPVPDGTGFGSSFHLVTNMPVAATAIYPFGGAPTILPSATLLLPVPTWSTQHIVINGWEVGNHGKPGAQIVAAEDDTELTLLPKRDIQGGVGIPSALAGVPVSYRLAKGQVLQLLQDEELTGSILTSNKPTTVFGGHSVAWVPVTEGTGDILSQQIPAFERWGSEYVGVGYRPRRGNEHEPVMYRIVAARDGTRLDYDPAVPPGAPLEMSAGEMVTFESGTGDAFVVRTQDVDHPVYLAAFMTGGGLYQSHGDPEFVNVVPAGQYLSSYSFYADPTYPETSLVIVRAKTDGAFKDVWLECAGNLSGWRPVGERGIYEFVRVDLSRSGGPGETFGASTCTVGLQRMRSDGAFTATLWGWGKDTSYAYPGGMAQRKLVEKALDPLR